MNILMVGAGSGSWEVRGKQLGAALGARTTGAPTEEDWRWADIVIFVKRAFRKHYKEASRSNKTVIWDVLDAWAQPEQNHCDVAALRIMAKADALEAQALTIGATRVMAEALSGVYLPHHSRPGLLSTPARKDLRVVAYEGTPKYLGRWKKALESTCARLGLQFQINPKNLAHADLVVAFRDGRWDGQICRQWKSGVKYVNAITAGRPILTQPHAAFDELQPQGRLLNDPSELEAAIEAYLPYEARKSAYEHSAHRSQEFALSAIAERYHGILTRAWKQAA